MKSKLKFTEGVWLSYQYNEYHGADEAEDEVVVRSQPAISIGAVAERIDYTRNGDDHQRGTVSDQIIPAQPRFFRFEYLDQHHV